MLPYSLSIILSWKWWCLHVAHCSGLYTRFLRKKHQSSLYVSTCWRLPSTHWFLRVICYPSKWYYVGRNFVFWMCKQPSKHLHPLIAQVTMTLHHFCSKVRCRSGRVSFIFIYLGTREAAPCPSSIKQHRGQECSRSNINSADSSPSPCSSSSVCL